MSPGPTHNLGRPEYSRDGSRKPISRRRPRTALPAFVQPVRSDGCSEDIADIQHRVQIRLNSAGPSHALDASYDQRRIFAAWRPEGVNRPRSCGRFQRRRFYIGSPVVGVYSCSLEGLGDHELADPYAATTRRMPRQSQNPHMSSRARGPHRHPAWGRLVTFAHCLYATASRASLSLPVHRSSIFILQQVGLARLTCSAKPGLDFYEDASKPAGGVGLKRASCHLANQQPAATR